MATEDAGAPAADAPAAPEGSSPEDGGRKRKVSPGSDVDVGSAKRVRQGSPRPCSRSVASSRLGRRSASPPRPGRRSASPPRPSRRSASPGPGRRSASPGPGRRSASPPRSSRRSSSPRPSKRPASPPRPSRRSASPPPSRRPASPPRRPAPPDVEHEHERTASVTQEERKRGRRLFGGLLSTLSQTARSSQQTRRQEIERRQLEKMQQQTADDGKQRAERRQALHKLRLEQQIAWEEQVMHGRHAKELKLARFLRTRSKPIIYYLPWKLTRREDDVIDQQISDTKARIARELEDFKGNKEKHLRRHGPRTKSDASAAANQRPQPAPGPETEAAATTHADATQEPAAAHDADARDDSSDILVEAEEDMVIY